VAASDDDTPCSPPRVNVQWLQGFSGLQNRRAVASTMCDDNGYGSRVRCFVGQNLGDLRRYF
jgi:hypothetical protein